MDVEIKPFAALRDTIGERSVRLETAPDATIETVLRSMEENHPGLRGTLLDSEGGTTDSIVVLRNGRHIDHFDGIETTLDPGDTVSLMPPLAGGSVVRTGDRNP